MRRVVEELEKESDFFAQKKGESDNLVLSWGCSYWIVLNLILVV
jgi:hypothetical protein